MLINHKVFIFENEAQAQIAIDKINDSQGLPTDECISYILAETIDGNITIRADEVTISILGDWWVELEINYPNPFE